MFIELNNKETLYKIKNKLYWGTNFTTAEQYFVFTSH